MRHPVPTISTADVIRLLGREFGDSSAQASELLAPLDSTHPGAVARVTAAAVKLAGGDLDKLREVVTMATSDWRDVIAAAEYPRFMQLEREAPAEAKAAAIGADWDAYQAWLNG